MDYEALKVAYLEVLKEIGMDNLYDTSLKDAETSKKIVENENLFNNNAEVLVYIYSLVKRIDMDLLIDKKKLNKITDSAIYNDSIRNIMFYSDKPDYKEFLDEDEQIVLHISKDIEVLNKIEETIQTVKIQPTDTIEDNIVETITQNKSVDETATKNGLEKNIAVLSNIFNIKYKYVVYMLEEKKFIDNLIQQINTTEKNKPKIDKIYAAIKKYAMERL